MRLELKHLQHRFNFLLVLPQSRTEELMIGKLKELGIDVRWYIELIGFERTPDGFVCQLETKERAEEIRTELLIGADGAHSLVRNSLGMSFDGETEPQEFGLADVVLDDWPFPFDYGVLHQEPGQVLAFSPISEGHGRLVCNHPDVLNRLPAVAKVKEVNWQSTFRISYRQVEIYQQGNAYLAGDAAHIHSPVGGRGMNLGIEDAATLAWLIEKGDTGRYSGLRHTVGEKVLKFTEAQTRQIMSTNPLQRVLQNWVAPFMLQFPAVQRMAVTWLVGQDTPQPPWL